MTDDKTRARPRTEWHEEDGPVLGKALSLEVFASIADRIERGELTIPEPHPQPRHP